MARFLACTSPARGHLYPITPTLLELGRRGHDVHMCTVSSEVSALAASGVHAAGIEPAIEAIELNDWQSTEPSEGIARIFGAFAQRADYEIADLRRAIADTRPDCLIIHITTAGAAAVAEASGLRAGRVNDTRAAVGLAGLASVELYLTAEPFELPGLSYPESFRLVGPGVWEPNSDPVPWLDEVESPLVLVTASSEKQGDDGFIRTAIEALGGTDLAVAISTAAHAPDKFAGPATCGSSAGCCTCRSCNAPQPSSATATWASPRRR